MERWRGKVAVVTGASSGIGAAIVTKLVAEGLEVVGLARRKEKVEELAETLSNKSGKLHAVKADVTKEEDILAALDWIKTHLGPIHILVNNAGMGRPTTLLEGTADDFRTVFETNVLGLTIVTREAVKEMIANNVNGHVVHINSVLGHTVLPLPKSNVYPASKFAVTALTETLRQELVGLGSKIKVTSVSPGYVETEFVYTNGYVKDKEIAELLKTIPKLTGDDVADAVLYVLGTPPHVQITELTLRPTGGERA